MGRLSCAYPILLLLAGRGFSQDTAPKYETSLHLTCRGQAYVGVIAATPFHRRFPELDLRLTDPMGRTSGYGTHDRPIPHSQYGRIVELPEHPDISKSLGVEGCGANAGRYTLAIAEHADSHYVLTITGEDGKGGNGNQTQIMSFDAQTNRTCRYWFYFGMVKGEVAMKWLDETGRVLPTNEQPICSLFQRADLDRLGRFWDQR